MSKRVLWLTKRRYMGGDLLEHFGRYWEIPVRLAQRGHRITVAATSYDLSGTEQSRVEAGLYLMSAGLSGLARWRQLLKTPSDVIIGSSDMHFCLLAVRLAKRHNLPSICDVYDNFDTFRSAQLPGLKARFYSSLAKSTLVVASDPLLGEHLAEKTLRADIAIEPNGYDPDVFKPMNKTASRHRFGLDPADKVIVYTGNISHQRGVPVLLAAHRRVCERWPRARLILAGPRLSSIDVSGPGVTYLGRVPQVDVAQLLNAADVAVACMADESVGRYWHPVKLIEYAACETPFVAAAMGSSARLLQDYPQHLYMPEDPEDLAGAIDRFLSQPPSHQPKFPDWDKVADSYSQIIEDI